MIRFWTFAIGLALTVMAAREMNPSGYDLREFYVLLTMPGLIAVALVVEAVASTIETREEHATWRYRAEHGLSASGYRLDAEDFDEEAGKVHAEEAARMANANLERTTEAEQAAGAAPVRLRPGRLRDFMSGLSAGTAGEVHTLNRTWAPRPDQALPPVAPEDCVRDDENLGPAERILRARERGERA